MNKTIKILIVLLCLQSGISNAWTLFGPKDYDECILQGMRGVTSDTAAAHIARSCRAKFPAAEQEVSCKQVEFNALEMEAVTTDVEITGDGTYISVNVYNGNRNKSVKELEIELSNETDNETQTYKIVSPYYLTNGLQPLSTRKFTTQIQRPKYREVIYKVKAVRGCEL